MTGAPARWASPSRSTLVTPGVQEQTQISDQIFAKESLHYYAEHLALVAGMLPPEAGIRTLLLLCSFEKSPLYARIEGQWSEGARNLSAQVRNALIAVHYSCLGNLKWCSSGVKHQDLCDRRGGGPWQKGSSSSQ
jgi:hypothetical protein